MYICICVRIDACVYALHQQSQILYYGCVICVTMCMLLCQQTENLQTMINKKKCKHEFKDITFKREYKIHIVLSNVGVVR